MIFLKEYFEIDKSENKSADYKKHEKLLSLQRVKQLFLTSIVELYRIEHFEGLHYSTSLMQTNIDGTQTPIIILNRTKEEMVLMNTSTACFHSVILFCLLDQYRLLPNPKRPVFSQFWIFFPNLRILLGFIPKF